MRLRSESGVTFLRTAESMRHGIAHTRLIGPIWRTHPEYAKVLAENNAETIRELTMAIGELQLRPNKVDRTDALAGRHLLTRHRAGRLR